ncbi:MAG: hypothetical protein ACRDQ5_18030 [Sciscionella sp.]
MITTTRVTELCEMPGFDWIGVLQGPRIAALARGEGPLRMSLFDVHNVAEFVAEFTHKEHNVGKHFVLESSGTSLAWRRDHDKITEEASLDGLYVIRTSLDEDEDTLDASATITAYKNFAFVERDFRVIRVDDLDLRPIWHYLDTRVHAHVFLCMPAPSLTWHLRNALAELTFCGNTDSCPPYGN